MLPVDQKKCIIKKYHNNKSLGFIVPSAHHIMLPIKLKDVFSKLHRQYIYL